MGKIQAKQVVLTTGSGNEDLRFAYEDDEGDLCTLTVQTVADALELSFAKQAEKNTEELVLSLRLLPRRQSSERMVVEEKEGTSLGGSLVEVEAELSAPTNTSTPMTPATTTTTSSVSTATTRIC